MKKVLCISLVCALLLSVLGVSAFAEGLLGEGTTQVQTGNTDYGGMFTTGLTIGVIVIVIIVGVIVVLKMRKK